MTTVRSRGARRVSALLVAATLVVAACGGDDDDTSSATTPPAGGGGTTAPDTATPDTPEVAAPAPTSGGPVVVTVAPETAPDCLDILRRELDLLEAARKVLAEHAAASSRTGWKLMSPMAFMRLWLSSAETVTSIVKARFVIETATTADFDRLLSGVYARIERQGPPLDQRPLTAQPLLPGLAEEVVEGDFSPSEGEFADRRRPTADSQEPTANSQ